MSAQCIFVSFVLLPEQSVLRSGSFGYMNHAQYICHAHQVHSVSDKNIL